MTENKDEGGLVAIPGGVSVDPRQEVINLFLDVVSPLIMTERRFLDPQSAINDFLRRRLPVYADAFKRGYPAVLQKLQQGPLYEEHETKIARREIHLTPDGILRWQVVMQSQDPIESFRFTQSYKGKGYEMEGESEIWQDGYVLEQMIKEGRGEQKRLFAQWSQACGAIARQQEGMSNVGQYQFMKYFYHPASFRPEGLSLRVQTDTLGYQDIRALGSNVDKLKGTALEEGFIEDVVIEGGVNKDAIDRSLRVSRSVDHIESMFTWLDSSKKLVSVPYNVRIRVEDTFLVEFLTNPGFLKLEGRTSQPYTTPERLRRFYQILDVLSKAETERRKGLLSEADYGVFYLIDSAFEQNQELVEQILDREDIDIDTGCLYLRSMLSTRLRHHVLNRTHLGGMVDKTIFVLGQDGLQQSSDEMVVDEARTIAENFFRYDYRTVWDAWFRSNAQYTEMILDEIVNYPELGVYGEKKQRGLWNLLGRFRTDFDPDSKMFRFKPLQVDESNFVVPETVDKYRRIYLEKLLKAYKTKNLDVESLMNYMVLKPFVQSHLTEMGFKLVEGGIVTDHAIETHIKKANPKLQALDYTAYKALSEYFAISPSGFVSDFIGTRIADNTVRVLQKFSSLFRSEIEKKMDDLGEGGEELFEKMAEKRVEEILDEVWQKNFGKVYGEDRHEGIKKILVASLET